MHSVNIANLLLCNLYMESRKCNVLDVRKVERVNLRTHHYFGVNTGYLLDHLQDTTPK